MYVLANTDFKQYSSVSLNIHVINYKIHTKHVFIDNFGTRLYRVHFSGNSVETQTICSAQ